MRGDCGSVGQSVGRFDGRIYLKQRFEQIPQWVDYLDYLDKLRKGADVIQLPQRTA